jgi:SAM-dependent methyltransferase
MPTRVTGTLVGEDEHVSEPEFIYDAIAAEYAKCVEDNVWNAHYERANSLRLVGEVAGRSVLDAGCGPGAHAAALANRGARVTGIDRSSALLGIAAGRLGDRARLVRGDLSDPLPFEDRSFDVVLAALVMHYLRDWAPTLAEFHRVLAPQGRLVISTHHPTLSHAIGEGDDYFATYEIDDEWEVAGRVTRMRYWHRPLSAISRALADGGFVIERLDEPPPDAVVRQIDPEAWEKLRKRPWFLFIVARREPAPPPASPRRR